MQSSQIIVILLSKQIFSGCRNLDWRVRFRHVLETRKDFKNRFYCSIPNGIQTAAATARSTANYFAVGYALRKRSQPEENKKPFPKVIGCIDGTQVSIKGTGVDNKEHYRNRKNFYSLNVQGVCYSDLIFTNVFVRWQGSKHDSRVYTNSILCAEMEKIL